MRHLTRFAVVAVCVLGGSVATLASNVGPVVAATLIEVDSTASTAGNCSQPGQCTFTAAITLSATSPDSTIVLPAGTFDVSTPLVVPSTGFAITGAGAATVIAGTGSVRLLEASGGSLKLTDLTLSGGFSDQGGGGAIFATNTDVALDGVIVSNNAGLGDGGAIGLVGGSLSVTNSNFLGNYGQNGGAVFTANAAVAIAGSQFAENGASSSGGAAFISFPTSFAVTDSTFSLNQSITDGGAVSVEGVGDNGTLGRLERTSFDGNSAAGMGGAVFVRTSPTPGSAGLTISDSTFTDNSADAGGALALSDPPVVITGSTFRSNTAEGSGGAIVSNTLLTVTGGAFERNAAGESGGAIASSGMLSVGGAEFVANSAGGSGGAFLLIGELPTIAGTFSGNSADGEGPVAFWTGHGALSIAGVSSSDIYSPLVAQATPTPTPAPTPTTDFPPTTTGATTIETPVPTTTPGPSIDGRPGVAGATPDAPNPAPGGFLPETGATIFRALALAALTASVGLILMTVRRRRSATDH